MGGEREVGSGVTSAFTESDYEDFDAALEQLRMPSLLQRSNQGKIM